MWDVLVIELMVVPVDGLAVLEVVLETVGCVIEIVLDVRVLVFVVVVIAEVIVIFGIVLL